MNSGEKLGLYFTMEGKVWKHTHNSPHGSHLTRRLNPGEEPPRYANLLLVGGVGRYPEVKMILDPDGTEEEQTT